MFLFINRLQVYLLIASQALKMKELAARVWQNSNTTLLQKIRNPQPKAHPPKASPEIQRVPRLISKL